MQQKSLSLVHLENLSTTFSPTYPQQMWTEFLLPTFTRTTSFAFKQTECIEGVEVFRALPRSRALTCLLKLKCRDRVGPFNSIVGESIVCIHRSGRMAGVAAGFLFGHRVGDHRRALLVAAHEQGGTARTAEPGSPGIPPAGRHASISHTAQQRFPAGPGLCCCIAQ